MTAFDTILVRDAANTLACRNSTNPCTVNIYGSFTDTSNKDYISITKAAGGAATISTIGAGTGTGGNLQFAVPVTAGAGVSATSVAYFAGGSGHLLWNTDNTYDIGASAATRPRNLYIAGTATMGGVISTTSTTDSTTTTSGALQVAGGAAIRKRVFIDGITTSSGLQTAVLCQSSGGEMIADSVACLASAGHFKDIRGPMPDGALAKIALLPIDLWSYKPEGKFTSDDWTRERIGPIADNVAAMDPRLAGYDSDGKVRTYSTEQLLAFTIKALQELKADNDNLRTEVRRIAR